MEEVTLIQEEEQGVEVIPLESTPIPKELSKPIKRLRCLKCNEKFKIESRERLLHTECPNCGIRGRIRK